MKIIPTLTAGDSHSWREAALYEPGRGSLVSADWSLTYELRGPSALTLPGVQDGTGWKVSITTEQSAALVAGVYNAVLQLSRPGERITVGRATVTVLADPSTSDEPVDARSIAQKALADCEKAMASFSAGGKVQSYTIGGRTMQFQSLADLMSVRNFWARQVKFERAKAAGRQHRRNTLVARFV